MNNDPFYVVFYNDSTNLNPEIAWFYERSVIKFVKTNHNVKDRTNFNNGSLVLWQDGFIRIIKKNRFKKQLPFALFSNNVFDGMKCCRNCIRILPVSYFVNGALIRTEQMTSICTFCRESSTSSDKNPSTFKAQKKVYMRERRLQIIRNSGCQWPGGCNLNQLIPVWSDEYVIGAFDFNHINDKDKIHQVSDYRFFTDNKAKKHGFDTWKELFEAELSQCDVLCKGHHAMFSKNQKNMNREHAYDNKTK